MCSFTTANLSEPENPSKTEKLQYCIIGLRKRQRLSVARKNASVTSGTRDGSVGSAGDKRSPIFGFAAKSAQQDTAIRGAQATTRYSSSFYVLLLSETRVHVCRKVSHRFVVVQYIYGTALCVSKRGRLVVV